MKLFYPLFLSSVILLGVIAPSARAQTPVVTTVAATSLTGTNATLNGTVNPVNSVTTFYFAYTADTNFYSATIPNPSFELNTFTVFPGDVANNTSITGWTVNNPSPIGLNPADGSPFANNGATPDGTNVAFIQSNYGETNTLSTTITGLIVGKTYQVSFRANRRDGYTTPNGSWSLNGGSFIPFTTDPAVGGTNAYYTNSARFTATTGTAALALQNFTPDDSTILLDAFSIVSVPFNKFSATNTLSATNATLAVSNVVSGLQPGTTYYFRIVASNSAGSVTGNILTFTTGIGLPTATTLAATGISANNAILNATVNTGGAATAAHFQYGTGTNYGFFSATNNLAATNTTLSISNLVGGLSAGTLYHFRVVATNSMGTTFGLDQTFATPSVPTVTTLPPTGITTNNATLNGTVNPNGYATIAWFQYGTDTSYGSFSATNNLTATNITLSVSNLVGALLPGTLYHCRLVASNSFGVVTGLDQTFTSIRLATVVSITNAASSGSGTLRQAILDSVPNDTILFDAGLSGSSILLTNGQLFLTNSVTIDASALTNGIRINGNGSSRLFQVESNISVVLKALTLTNGTAVSSGGGIYNSGNLTLDRCTLVGNSAVGLAGSTGADAPLYSNPGGTGGTGGTGAGGAIYNAGTLIINQCTFTANTARGGNGGTGGAGSHPFAGSGPGGRGGSGGTGGTGMGGAIYNAGALTVNQSTLAMNTASGGSGGSGGPGSNGASSGSVGSGGGGTAGGIYQGGSSTLFNSIVAVNNPDNLFGSATQTGTNLTTGDPLLSALGNNGGPTPTMVLLAGSPAFEAGGAPTLFAVDQRGFTRPMGSAPDIGAVEMTAPNVTTTSASALTNTSATLNGLVNPNGLAVSAFFQYGTTTNYGSFSSTNSLVTTNVALAVVGPLANLQPATTYHFRIVVIGNIGLTIGSDVTFTTTTGIPQVATTAASGPSASSATLNGTVNPSGLSTAAYFEYGTTTGYGLFSATNILSSTNIALSVSTLVSNLSPGVLYHFRLAATSSAGSSTGGDQTFTTLPLVPVATTLVASGITSTTATLNGLVNPGNGATTVYFQYNRTTNFTLASATILNPSFEENSFLNPSGQVSINGPITGWTASNTFRIGLNPAGGNPFADNGTKPAGTNVAFIQSINDTNILSTTISNLVVSKTYVVRFRANCRGSGYAAPNSTWTLNGGSFVPFTSSPAVGSTNAYYTNSASFTATNSTAALIIQNATAADSTVLVDDFSIIEDPFNGGFSATNFLAASVTNSSVSATISGLQPATTYHFQVVAINSSGTATGADLTFTTAGAGPIATTLPATGVVATGATLNGTVNSQGNVTTSYFQYGTSTNYGSFSASTNTLTGTNIAVAVTQSLAGLTPATLYHFRVVASNSQSVVFGVNQTFTTANAAPAIIPLSVTTLTTNAANGLLSVQLSATVRPNGSTTAGYFEYGRTTAYAATNSFSSISSNTVATNVSITVSFSAGFSYHWRVVATNGVGSATSADQTFNLGSLVTSTIPGDLNSDGLISQSELDAVYYHYATNSPWLYLTNVAGLGQTNVSFALQDSLLGDYTAQYSTNLIDWFNVGPASPRYNFIDTNASTLPQRFYRLTYP